MEPTTNEKVYRSFEEFWPFYLSQHSHPTSRYLHIIGTTTGVAIFANGLLHLRWRPIFPALIVAYGCAWIGHFVFEKNRPATFTYPKWSFMADFRMLKLFYTGKLDAELVRLGLAPPPDQP